MERNRGGRPRHPDVLTPAEWRVLEELRAGGTNAEIAVRLGVSPDAVKYHVSNMLGKLGLEDRHALAAWRPGRKRARGRLRALFALPAPLTSLASPLAWGGAVLAVAAGAVVLAVVLVAVSGDGDGEPPLALAPTSTVAPMPASAPTATTAPAPAPGATATPSATPAAPPTPTPAPTPTPTPTSTPTPTPTAAPTATPTATPTPTPSPAPACAQGIGLAEDCETLLAVKAALDGAGALNWSAGVPVSEWDGVTVGGTPERVTGLDLASRGLTGAVPPALGNLAELRELRLDGNALTGRIPSKLALLAVLLVVDVSGNSLTGCAPAAWKMVPTRNLGGLPYCALPLDAWEHRDDGMAGGKTYRFQKNRRTRPLILDLPEGRTFTWDAESGSGPPGVASSLLIVRDSASSSSIAFNWYTGTEEQRSEDPAIGAILDEIAASAWMGELETQAPAPTTTTVRYNLLDTTGGATTPGSYAFLQKAGDAASAIDNFGYSASAGVELRIHPIDATGASHAALYDTIKVGDSFDYRTGPRCGFRFKITRVSISGPPGIFGLGLEWVAGYGGRCWDFVDDPGAAKDVSFVWWPGFGYEGPDGIRVMLHGEPAGEGTYRIVEGSDVVIDIPAGMRLIADGLWVLEPSEDDPPDAPRVLVPLTDEETGSRLSIDPGTGKEVRRIISEQAEASTSRDVNALFDQIMASVRLIPWPEGR